MNRPLRRAHRLAWVILAPLALAILAAGLWAAATRGTTP